MNTPNPYEAPKQDEGEADGAVEGKRKRERWLAKRVYFLGGPILGSVLGILVAFARASLVGFYWADAVRDFSLGCISGFFAGSVLYPFRAYVLGKD